MSEIAVTFNESLSEISIMAPFCDVVDSVNGFISKLSDDTGSLLKEFNSDMTPAGNDTTAFNGGERSVRVDVVVNDDKFGGVGSNKSLRFLKMLEDVSTSSYWIRPVTLGVCCTTKSRFLGDGVRNVPARTGFCNKLGQNST